MRNHRICSRPHVQGDASPLRIRHSARKLTDGGGLILVRYLWDGLGLGSWIDRRSEGLAGYFRPSLMVEVWVVLLLYGGRVLDDLPLLDRRGIRRLFGWTRLPDPTTFGRWLRRAGEPLVPLARTLPRRTPVARRAPALETQGHARGADPDPRFHCQRALRTQAQETGDCMDIRWRPGNAHTAAEAEAWITDLVGRLRCVGVETITVRLDKGFFSRSMVKTLDNLKLPAQAPCSPLACGPSAALASLSQR